MIGGSEHPRERPDVLRRLEFRVHSQNWADGILLYVFSVLGTTDRRFIEFGCVDGRECNTANLSVNFGWRGLLMDRDPGYADAARAYYLDRLGPDGGVTVAARRIDRDNVNDVLQPTCFAKVLWVRGVQVFSFRQDSARSSVAVTARCDRAR